MNCRSAQVGLWVRSSSQLKRIRERLRRLAHSFQFEIDSCAPGSLFPRVLLFYSNRATILSPLSIFIFFHISYSFTHRSDKVLPQLTTFQIHSTFLTRKRKKERKWNSVTFVLSIVLTLPRRMESSLFFLFIFSFLILLHLLIFPPPSCLFAFFHLSKGQPTGEVKWNAQTNQIIRRSEIIIINCHLKNKSINVWSTGLKNEIKNKRENEKMRKWEKNERRIIE